MQKAAQISGRAAVYVRPRPDHLAMKGVIEGNWREHSTKSRNPRLTWGPGAELRGAAWPPDFLCPAHVSSVSCDVTLILYDTWECFYPVSFH